MEVDDGAQTGRMHGSIPRVAHRHMYLWLEDQIELRQRTNKDLTRVESQETFLNEVMTANTGNEHFSLNKLKELVAKAPPYSLL
jgi:hypothetical protein